MEKTKKILSLLIIIATIFQVSVFAENTSSKRANLKSTEKELAQNVISNLEIMDYSEDNETDVISRIDFAVYFGRLLQVDEYSKQNVTYYKDVPDDHYALACLNYITQMGGFDGTGDTEFCPNDPISPTQAAKVIFNVLGYRTYANALGGYPLAYLNLSKDTGLLDGFDGCNDITRNEMMVLLFRAGFIDKMEVANFKNESLEFNNKNSGSLFEENWDVYDYSGVLKNSGVITLDESIKTSDGRTVFDNVSYKNNGIDTEKYLGRYVRLITRETDDEDILIYIIADENRNEETVIDADDFIGYSNNTVRYYDDEKERKYNVDTAATVLLNGDIVKYDIESAMKIKKGEITLIDSNMDDVADTVIINSFKSCVVGYVDAGNELVYDKRSKSVIANADIYDCVRIHNDVDTEMTLSEITAGTIISVRKGEKLLDITVSTQSASGTLAAVKSDTKEYKFEIDGKDYIIDDDLLNDTTWFNDKTFIGKIGSDYTLYMDCFGYVVELKAGAASSGMYGYIVKYAPDTKMGDTLCMKLFTSEGEMKIFECAAKVMVDGVAQKQIQSIINAIELGDKELIFFRTDSDGKISYIDTSYHNHDAESENTLSVSAEKKNRNAKAENASLDGDIRPSSSTVKFIVPDDVTTGKDKDYSISSGYGYSEDQTAITKAYKIDKDHIMCDVLIEYRESNYTPDFKLKRAFVVNRIYRGLNSDGDAAWQVEGYSRGSKKVYTFTSDVMDKFENLASNAQISGIEDIEPGDILRVAANDFGEIFSFQLFVDYSEGLDTVPKWGKVSPANHGGYVDTQVRMFCKRAQDGVAEFMFDKSDDPSEIMIGNMNGKAITVVDTSKTKNMVRGGTVADVQQYDVMGENTLPMFMFMWRYSPRDIVIYK